MSQLLTCFVKTYIHCFFSNAGGYLFQNVITSSNNLVHLKLLQNRKPALAPKASKYIVQRFEDLIKTRLLL